MQRILVLNYEFPPLGGGASSVSYEIAKRYLDQGYEVDVVTMKYRGLPSYEVVDGINVYRVNCLRGKTETCETHEMLTYVISAINFLRSRLKKINYDYCHCHFLIPTGVVALYIKKFFGLDYIVTIHGSDVPGYNSDRFTLEHKFTRPLLNLIGKNAKKVCSPSLFLQELAEKNIGSLDFIHVPNGLDFDQFQPDPSKPKERIILSTGRLVKRKGFHTLINAVHDIALPYEVHLAGDGPFREELETMAEGSKTRIVFHGWLEKGSKELLDLYERAAIYVLASSKENASIALLEGMAARCAVISTNVSGCPETVGDAGFLIDFDDHEKLKQILLDLCKDENKIEYYADKAYKRLLDEFLWERSCEKYIEAFK